MHALIVSNGPYYMLHKKFGTFWLHAEFKNGQGGELKLLFWSFKEATFR